MITTAQALCTPWTHRDIEQLGEHVYVYWLQVVHRHGSFTNIWNDVVIDASLGNEQAKKIIEFAEIEYVKWRLKG